MTIEEKIEALKHEAARAAETEDAEPLDPTTATMASLCESDIATGRLSSKYLEKGIAYVKMWINLQPPVTKPEPTPVPSGAEVDEDGNPIAGPSRRRELGASLSPSPEREPELRRKLPRHCGATVQDEDSVVVVDGAGSTRLSNSNGFMKKAGSRGSRWTADETELFYWCLSAFGEDYENITRYLGRTPLQCKNKTKSEDRRGNEKQITLAIKTRIPLADLEEFERITGRDFSGPPSEIRAPVAPPRAESEEQAPVTSYVKAKATSSTPSTAPWKNRKLNSHAEEEIMTPEEYERDGKDD
ncbi:Transcription factor TFIIIB component B [Ceratobasidium sp. 423]|nr:Transcription factor TFIIIB component B [Ceratobasidium sp. 423]